VFLAQIVGAVVAATLLAALVLALAQARTLARRMALIGLAGAFVAAGFAVASELSYRDCKEWNEKNVRWVRAGGTVVQVNGPLARRCERE
jgi:hypothetical protein